MDSVPASTHDRIASEEFPVPLVCDRADEYIDGATFDSLSSADVVAEGRVFVVGCLKKLVAKRLQGLFQAVELGLLANAR
jgi:hypothetical protein